MALSANMVTVHWLKREPSTKKSAWNTVALALMMKKPPSPVQHRRDLSGSLT